MAPFLMILFIIVILFHGFFWWQQVPEEVGESWLSHELETIHRAARRRLFTCAAVWTSVALAATALTVAVVGIVGQFEWIRSIIRGLYLTPVFYAQRDMRGICLLGLFFVVVSLFLLGAFALALKYFRVKHYWKRFYDRMRKGQVTCRNRHDYLYLRALAACTNDELLADYYGRRAPTSRVRSAFDFWENRGRVALDTHLAGDHFSRSMVADVFAEMHSIGELNEALFVPQRVDEVFGVTRGRRNSAVFLLCFTFIVFSIALDYVSYAIGSRIQPAQTSAYQPAETVTATAGHPCVGWPFAFSDTYFVCGQGLRARNGSPAGRQPPLSKSPRWVRTRSYTGLRLLPERGISEVRYESFV